MKKLNKDSEHFDYIICGGGAAGLSLAIQLVEQGLSGKKILILDRELKNNNDRTWCFWLNGESPYPHITFRGWNQLAFNGVNFTKVFPLGDYRYYMIRGLDFYNYARSYLSQFPNITSLNAQVTSIEDGEELALVKTDNGQFSAEWIFDSRFNPKNLTRQENHYHYLFQHFRGWEVETSTDIFDPQTPTLFDFRTPQNGCMRFIYILPFSPRHALVEYTLFSDHQLNSDEYDQGLRAYFSDILHLSDFKIASVENGVIPMSDHPFPRRLGHRILAIGTLGGLVKPSTGYAFLRIQHDSQAIAKSLRANQHPFDLPRSPQRYSLFDSIMLQVMKRHGHEMSAIFTQLFRNNPIERIFRFLDETNRFSEDLKLLASLPFPPFIAALVRLKILRSV